MKQIQFAKKEQFIDSPIPAIEAIPDWYKKAPKFPVHKNTTVVGFKSCIPFLDSMSCGYYLLTPCDISIAKTATTPSITWSLDWAPVTDRNEEATRGIVVPNNFYDQVYAWWVPYIFESSPKTSLLITHPLNRTDLPFLTTSGIVDMTGTLGAGHLPFFIDKNFEGIIPKGTPFAQVIPFERHDWTMSENTSIIENGERANFKSKSKFFGYYRDNLWSRKKYTVTH